jgi:hypothetical protein
MTGDFGEISAELTPNLLIQNIVFSMLEGSLWHTGVVVSETLKTSQRAPTKPLLKLRAEFGGDFPEIPAETTQLHVAPTNQHLSWRRWFVGATCTRDEFGRDFREISAELAPQLEEGFRRSALREFTIKIKFGGCSILGAMCLSSLVHR